MHKLVCFIAVVFILGHITWLTQYAPNYIGWWTSPLAPAFYTSVTHIRYAKSVTHFIPRPLRSYAVTPLRILYQTKLRYRSISWCQQFWSACIFTTPGNQNATNSVQSGAVQSSTLCGRAVLRSAFSKTRPIYCLVFCRLIAWEQSNCAK